jgi:hypothetical protein
MYVVESLLFACWLLSGGLCLCPLCLALEFVKRTPLPLYCGFYRLI